LDATTAYVFLLLAALQGGLGIPLLLALILAFLVLIPFIVQVFRRAAKRNPKRPGGEDDDGGEVSEGRERQVVRFFGMLLAATGVLLALTGVVCAFFPNLVGNVVPAASLGIFLGFAGFAMRARRMGAAAAIIATAALLLGVAASQGIIPGVEPTDRNLPSVEPSDSQGD
jgi:multidrug efflux pump subunit AcrB